VAKSGLSGLGTVTRVYDPDTAARNNAGTWYVELSIAEGQNFTGVDVLPLSQPYTIRKALFTEALLTYSGVPKEVAWTGENHGIATPTLKGLGTNYTGTLSVVYERGGEEYAMAVDSGTYRVKVRIGGDRNFSPYELDLGAIIVHGANWVSVVAGSREIPASVVVEEAAVAPIKAVTAEVTVGPNPVRANAEVSVYWNGSKPVSGKLSVFSALGQKVGVVEVSGKSKGKVGSWKASAEGTYLLKGVLTEKDGTRVKVSTLVSVAR